MKTIMRNSAITVFLTASFALNGMNNAHNLNNAAYAETALRILRYTEIETLNTMANGQLTLQTLKNNNSPIAEKYQQQVLILEKHGKTILDMIKKLEEIENHSAFTDNKNLEFLQTQLKIIENACKGLSNLQIDVQTMLNDTSKK